MAPDSPDSPPAIRRVRRGLGYDDELRPAGVVLDEPITPETVRRLIDERQSAVRIGPSVPASTLAQLAAATSVHRLDLSGHAGVVDDDLAFLAAMPWLTAISLAQCRGVADAGVAHLRGCDALEEIDLRWTATGDGAVSTLAGKPALARVSLGGLLTDAGVARLRDLPALREPGVDDTFLAISSATALTDKALAAVGDLAGIQALDVSNWIFGSEHFTARGVAHLPRMTSLEELNFNGDLASDEVLREIARIPRLRVLGCQDMIAGDEGFVALGACPMLESIWGRHCDRVGDRGFAALGQLPRLKKLALGGHRISDAALAALIDAPSLVDLQPILFGDEAFQYIARMPRLARLVNMYNRDTTDAATRHLRGHPGLTHYGAHGTQITDDSLEVLADLPALDTIEFENCDRITDAGLAALSRAPRLRRVSAGGCMRVAGRWMAALASATSATPATLAVSRPDAGAIETTFDPANPSYVQQYQFWTLVDYPDLAIAHAPRVPPAPESANDLLGSAYLLNLGAEWHGNDLRIFCEPHGPWRRFGLITRDAFAVPLRLQLVVSPFAQLGLFLGRRPLVEDGITAAAPASAAAGAWTRVRVEIGPTTIRVFVDDQVRHTATGEFADLRGRVVIAPRQSSLRVRDLTVDALPAQAASQSPSLGA